MSREPGGIAALIRATCASAVRVERGILEGTSPDSAVACPFAFVSVHTWAREFAWHDQMPTLQQDMGVTGTVHIPVELWSAVLPVPQFV